MTPKVSQLRVEQSEPALTQRNPDIEGFNILSKQVFRSMSNMIISKRGHGEVAVVVIGLVSNVDSLLLTDRFGGFGEVLR